jgi:DNA repair exonuclease SbcCD ATPase subunit
MEVQKMVSLFGEASPQVAAAAQKAAELKDQIDDANDAVSAFTGAGKFQAIGKAIQGVAGGFTAIQGAMGLLGSESQDLQKTLVKVQSALALTQGLAALEDVGRAFKTLKSVAVDSFNGIKAAIGSTGVGLLIVAIGVAVQQLVSAFQEASEAEKKQKKDLEDLAEAYDKVKAAINASSADLKRSTDLAVAEAEKEKKSIKEIAQIREDASNEQSRLIIVEMEELKNNLATRIKAAQLAAKEEGKSVSEAKRKAEADYEKERKAFNERLYDLDNERKIAAIRTEQEINAKIAEENAKAKKAREDRAKNELDALNALNEARRKKAEAAAADELDKAKVKYDNDLVRLQEAKAKELKAENLTEQAKANIRERYKVDAETLLIEYNNLVLTLTEKGNKEVEAANKKAAEDFLKTQEEKYTEAGQRTQKFYNQEQTDLNNSTLKGREFQKAQEQLNLDRLQRERRDAIQYKKDTSAIDTEISKQNRAIAEGDAEFAKSQRQQAFDFAISSANQLTDALSTLSKARMSEELAAAGDNAEKQEQIKQEYFEKDKNFQYAKATIAGIQAGVQAFAQGMAIGGPPLAALFLALSATTTGIQLAAIASSQYVSSANTSTSNSRTQSTPSTYAEGGLLMGNSHDMGGIRTTMGELEGGEFVMNRRATANFLPLLQSINSLGNTPGPQVATAAQTPIVKTYVVATDMTSQQEANARLNALARL